MFFIYLYFITFFLAIYNLFNRGYILSTGILIFSSIPAVSLITDGTQDYYQYSIFYYSQLTLNLIVIIWMFFSRKNNDENHLFVDKSNKTFIIPITVFILFFILVEGILFTRNNSDYFWMMHRGEEVMSTHLYLIMKIMNFYAIFNLLFRRLKKTDLLLCLLILFLPNLYWFILGFRSPLMTSLLVLGSIAIYSNQKYIPAGINFKKRKFLILGIFFFGLFIFDFLTQLRYFGAYEFREPLIPFLTEVHVGTAAGKSILEKSFEISNAFPIIDRDDKFHLLCTIFSPLSYSQFIPRGITDSLVKLSGTSIENCISFSSVINDELSSSLRAGEGIASNLLGDLWYSFGLLSFPIYYMIFIAVFYLDQLIRNAKTKKRFQFLALLICFEAPQIFIIWRVGILSFPILDMVIIILLFIFINKNKS